MGGTVDPVADLLVEGGVTAASGGEGGAGGGIGAEEGGNGGGGGAAEAALGDGGWVRDGEVGEGGVDASAFHPRGAETPTVHRDVHKQPHRRRGRRANAPLCVEITRVS